MTSVECPLYNKHSVWGASLPRCPTTCLRALGTNGEDHPTIEVAFLSSAVRDGFVSQEGNMVGQQEPRTRRDTVVSGSGPQL